MSHFKSVALYLGLSWSMAGVLYAADGDIHAAGKFISDVTGQPPLVVNSANRVPNLNADMLDGMHFWEFEPAHRQRNISIPMKAVEISGSAEYDLNSWVLGIKLTAASNSQFGFSLVIPSGLEPQGLQLSVDILVHNPTANSACHAEIVPGYRMGYRPWEGIFIPTISYSPAFPDFISGNLSVLQTYTLTGMESDDAVYFGFIRKGNDAADDCGDVRLVGLNIRL